MQIVVQYVDDCVYWPIAMRRVRTALQRAGATARVGQHRIATEAEARAVNFRGSPTILINGIDAFPSPGAPVFACREYQTPQGRAEVPTVRQIVQAITSCGPSFEGARSAAAMPSP